MLTECRSCGDPLFEHMSQCRCGLANPDFVAATQNNIVTDVASAVLGLPLGSPPASAAETSDQHIESFLFGVGLLGPLAAFMLLLKSIDGEAAPAVATVARYAWPIVGALGLGALVLYRRIHVPQLTEGQKRALKSFLWVFGAMVCAALVVIR